MPLLRMEPNLFPRDLFEETDSPVSEPRLWWVMHTKPRQEKCLAKRLFAAQIPFYLPLLLRRWRLRGRLLKSYIPLFTGYTFVLADRKERLAALTTNRIVRALEVPNQAALWHDLRQIKRLIDTDAPITAEDRLKPGMTVEIRSGPLSGLEGKILRTASGRRFVVAVDFIQKGASVLLENYVLAKVH